MEKTDGKEPGEKACCYWSPYIAGAGLGLTLLLSYWVLGTGLGASSAVARCTAWLEHLVAPAHVKASAYFGGFFSGERHVLAYYIVTMAIGIFAGGFLSALGSRRIKPSIERGSGFPAPARLALALIGGILSGFASRLARGCTSGQALSGTALLFTGSIAFMLAMFATAFLVARFFKRQWQ